MAKVIDLTESDGDLVVLGRSFVLPSSELDSQPAPLNGALRFNPTLGKAQVFFAGNWTTLGEGGGDSSGDGSNNHTHSISQILGLQTALSSKAPLVHTHNIVDITGLTTALASKAPVVHQHAIADTSGLQIALDNRSLVGHTHFFSEKHSVAACLPGNPPSLFKLVWTATEAITFLAGLPASQVKVTTNPTQAFVITLFKNGVQNVGTITIASNGGVTFAVAANISLLAGETLTFALPARDTTLNTVSLNIVGNLSPRTIT